LVKRALFLLRDMMKAQHEKKTTPRTRRELRERAS
jgi:hypothetical protein